MKNTEISALLKNISDSFLALSKIFSSTEEIDSAKQPKASVLEETGIEESKSETASKSYTKEEVRALLAQKAKADAGIYKADVKAIVAKYSSDGTLTKVPEENYPELVAALEVIGNG